MKKQYTNPELDIVRFEDVIITSSVEVVDETKNLIT